MYLNEYEVADAVERLADCDDLPNLRRAACTLARLVEWTNENSDGWPYWRKPGRASQRLQEIVHSYGHRCADGVDIDSESLKRALTPVKAFLTRQEVDHGPIIKEA